MIEQIDNAIKFLVFFTESKLGKTGLTVTVDVRNPAGTLVVTGGSATEVGGGLYSYTLASGSVTTEGEYTAVFKTATTTVDQREIPALWVVGRAGIEDLDALITSRSTYAGADTSGTTTLLARIPGTVTAQTGDAYARIGAAGAGLTALGDARLTNLDATVSSRSTVAAIFAFVASGTRTFAQVIRGLAATNLGKASGLDTGLPRYRDIADTKDVVSATTDASGNRTAVTLDLD